MNNDGIVHAKFTHDGEVFHIVRYDRAGKWYIESQSAGRRPVTLSEAVNTAVAFDAQHFAGLSGGSAFDRLMRMS